MPSKSRRKRPAKHEPSTAPAAAWSGRAWDEEAEPPRAGDWGDTERGGDTARGRGDVEHGDERTPNGPSSERG